MRFSIEVGALPHMLFAAALTSCSVLASSDNRETARDEAEILRQVATEMRTRLAPGSVELHPGVPRGSLADFAATPESWPLRDSSVTEELARIVGGRPGSTTSYVCQAMTCRLEAADKVLIFQAPSIEGNQAFVRVIELSRIQSGKPESEVRTIIHALRLNRGKSGWRVEEHRVQVS